MSSNQPMSEGSVQDQHKERSSEGNNPTTNSPTVQQQCNKDKVSVSTPINDDMDLMEVEVSNGTVRSDITTVDINMNDYERVRGTTKYEYLVELKDNLRNVDEGQVDNLDKLFETMYIEELASIIIVKVQGTDGSVMVDAENNRKVVATPVYVVDGRHRKRLYGRYNVSEEAWKLELARNIPIILYIRKDGKPITNQEAIGLASIFNNVTSSSLKMSFQDKIHGCVSLLRTAQIKGKPEEVLDINSINLATAKSIMVKVAFMKSLGDRQQHKYANVAYMCAKYDLVSNHFDEVCAESRNITLSHLDSTIILNSKDPTFICLALDCIKRKSQPRRGGIDGTFERIRHGYYLTLQYIYGNIKNECKERNLRTEDVLKEMYTITDEDVQPLSQIIANTMSNYGEGGASLEKSKHGKNRSIMKKVEEVIKGMGPRNEDKTIQPDQEKVKKDKREEGEGTQKNIDKPKDDENEKNDTTDGPRRSSRTKKQVPVPEIQEPSKQTRRQSKGKKGKNVNTTSTTKTNIQSVKKFLSATPRDEVCRLIQGLGIGITVSSRFDEEQTVMKDFTDGKDHEFDDHIPSNAPHGIEDLEVDTLPQVYDENAADVGQRLSEINKPSTPPVKFHGLNEDGTPDIERLGLGNKHLYLNQCCIGLVHRAHLLLDEKILLENHLQTWWNLQNEYCMGMSTADVKNILIKNKVPLNENHFRNIATCITCGLTDLDVYLAKKRMELDLNGYTIITGLWQEYGEKHFQIKSIGNHEWLDVLMKNFMDRFEKFQETGTDDYTYIANVGDAIDEKDHLQGIGRYQSTRKGVIENMEGQDSVKYAKYRALMDVRMGMLLSMMNLSDQVKKEAAMYCPNTGSRCLVSTKGVRRQKIHSDRLAMSKKRTLIENENPGYFTLATWESQAHIWAVPGSHRSIARTKSKHMFALSQSSTAEKIDILPYSLFIGRGDLQHAGAGSEDFLIPFEKPQARIHGMYFPANENFPNAISFVPNYSPRFAGDVESSDSDEVSASLSEEQEQVEEDSAAEEPNTTAMYDESPQARHTERGTDDQDDPPPAEDSDSDDNALEIPPVSRKRKSRSSSPESTPRKRGRKE